MVTLFDAVPVVQPKLQLSPFASGWYALGIGDGVAAPLAVGRGVQPEHGAAVIGEAVGLVVTAVLLPLQPAAAASATPTNKSGIRTRMYGIAGRLRDSIAPPCQNLLRSMTIAGLAALLAVSASGAPAFAANAQDRSFLQTALQDNADFRTLSGLAMQKIRNAKVRAFAQTISQQTDSADSALRSDARHEDVKSPGTLSPRASDQYGRIQAQKGNDAADEFLRDVAIDARISSYDFSAEAQSGESPALKRLASHRASELDRIAKEADSLRSGLR